MKRVRKGPPPRQLHLYADKNPDASWERMRGDRRGGGGSAARECRDTAVDEQGGICAYCERGINFRDSSRGQVEHFHPKSDKTGAHNWGLDWRNMLAVCDGGSSGTSEEKLDHPLPGNLSCDAYKNRAVQIETLPAVCDGYLLNPLDAPAFPNIFALDKSTGRFVPDIPGCANVQIRGNAYSTTVELVMRTVEALNLNCDRLTEKRRLIVRNIDLNLKMLRQKGVTPPDARDMLARRYFGTKWPAFFTTLRCCLGQVAENYLSSIGYDG